MEAEELSEADLQGLARAVREDWDTINPTADAYLEAIEESGAQTPADPVGVETAEAQVCYFLEQAGGWKGPRARAVKAELRERCGL